MEADHPEDEALLAVSQAADLEAALTLLNRDCELCATVMNIKEVRGGSSAKHIVFGSGSHDICAPTWIRNQIGTWIRIQAFSHS